MPYKYIWNRETDEIIPTDDVLEWAREFEAINRVVGDHRNESYRVSTVFLGLDHRFGDPGPPILFESMVFGVQPDGSIDFGELACERYSTAEEACDGHYELCEEWLCRRSGKSNQPSALPTTFRS